MSQVDNSVLTSEQKDMIFEIREVFGKLVRELLCVARKLTLHAN